MSELMICDHIPDDVGPNEWGALTEKNCPNLSDIPLKRFSKLENSHTGVGTIYGRITLINNFRVNRKNGGNDSNIFDLIINGRKREILVSADGQAYPDNLFKKFELKEHCLTDCKAATIKNRYPYGTDKVSPSLYEKLKKMKLGPLETINFSDSFVVFLTKYPNYLRNLDEARSLGEVVAKNYFQEIDRTPVSQLELLILNSQTTIKAVIKEAKSNGIDQINLTPIINHGIKAGATQKQLHMQVQAEYMPGHDSKYEHMLRNFHNQDCYLCDVDESRVVFDNGLFRVETPESPQYDNEVWIVPNEHVERYSNLNPGQVRALAEALKVTNRSLTQLGVNKNRYIAFKTLNPGYETEFHTHFRVGSADIIGTIEAFSNMSVTMSPYKSAMILKEARRRVEDVGIDYNDYTYN